MKSNLKSLIEKLSHISFTLYVITLYIFEKRVETNLFSEICFLVFAGFALIYILLQDRILLHQYFYFISSFICYGLISYFWAVDQSAAVTKATSLFKLLILCILVYHVFYFSNRIDIFLRSFLIAGLILCVYAIYLYGISGIITALKGRALRLGADISQENVMGMQAAITFVLCLYYAIYKKIWILYPISVVPLMLSMASGSKKTVLIVFVSIITFLYLKTGIKKVYKFITYILLLIIIFNMLINLPIFSLIRTRMNYFFASLAGEQVNEMSTITRKSMIIFGFNKFLEKPIFGFGLNGASMLYYIDRYRKTYLHCNFIELLVNGGILGFLAFYSMYMYLFKKLNPLLKERDTEAIIIFIILLNRLICDIASVSYYDKMTYIYLIVGFLFVNKKNMLLKIYNKRKQYD